jgi:hypothetical protein
VKAVLIGLAALLIVLLGWYFLRGGSPKESGVPQKTFAPAPILDGGATQPVVVNAPAVQESDAAGGRRQWRVVAYTYNREGQAKEKAAAVAQDHPELRPEVFTPNGRAPYLVTVGGTMSRNDAFALVDKVKGVGLPRDIYAQNYSGKGR